MQKNMQQREVDRKAKMDEMKKKQDAHTAEMKKILTPEQYQKWDADKKAKMEKRREMMKDRKGEFGKRKMGCFKKQNPGTHRVLHCLGKRIG